MKKIDILVNMVDNFWDLWFWYNISLSLLKSKKDIEIYFYSNDFNLFNKLWWEIKNLKYIDISYYKSPNNIILNLFDRKIDYDFLNSFDKNILLLNIWYLSFSSSSHSLHNTNFKVKNINVIHIIPSFLPWNWWVIINNDIKKQKEINIKKERKKTIYLKDEMYNKKWISIFCYKKSFTKLKYIILNNNEYVFFIFDNKIKTQKENIVNMQFLEINSYYNFLNLCDKNLVRWENSFLQSIINWNDFLFDIYKETQNIHLEKLQDLNEIINEKNYNNIINNFNSQNNESIKKAFKDYLIYKNKTIFESLSELWNNKNLIDEITKYL